MKKNILFIYHQTKDELNSHVQHKDDRQLVNHYVYPNLEEIKSIILKEINERNIPAPSFRLTNC